MAGAYSKKSVGAKALNRKAGGKANRTDVDKDMQGQAYGTTVQKGRSGPVPPVEDGLALTDGSPKDGWV